VGETLARYVKTFKKKTRSWLLDNEEELEHFAYTAYQTSTISHQVKALFAASPQPLRIRILDTIRSLWIA
jgi:hypothetical protein